MPGSGTVASTAIFAHAGPQQLSSHSIIGGCHEHFCTVSMSTSAEFSGSMLSVHITIAVSVIHCSLPLHHLFPNPVQSGKTSSTFTCCPQQAHLLNFHMLPAFAVGTISTSVPHMLVMHMTFAVGPRQRSFHFPVRLSVTHDDARFQVRWTSWLWRRQAS